MNTNLRIATKLRRFRDMRGLTLDSAAELSGISRSMLAKIEKGDASTTMSTLLKILGAYRISFSTLADSLNEKEMLIPQCTLQPVIENEEYIVYPIVPFDEGRQYELVRLVLAGGGTFQSEPHRIQSEECCTVIEGAVEVYIGYNRYILEQGDSLKFIADVPHSYRNLGNNEAYINVYKCYRN